MTGIFLRPDPYRLVGMRVRLAQLLTTRRRIIISVLMKKSPNLFGPELPSMCHGRGQLYHCQHYNITTTHSQHRYKNASRQSLTSAAKPASISTNIRLQLSEKQKTLQLDRNQEIKSHSLSPHPHILSPGPSAACVASRNRGGRLTELDRIRAAHGHEI